MTPWNYYVESFKWRRWRLGDVIEALGLIAAVMFVSSIVAAVLAVI